MKRISIPLSLITTHLLLAATLARGQGSLAPPAAPTPTMKTLDQVEARTPVDDTHTPGDGANSFIISQSGSYYLTGNLTGVSGKNGIAITSDNVTLDLNGFAIVGPGNTNNGVECGTQKNIAIRNGTIRSWLRGVNSGAAAARLRIERIRAVSNANTGILVGANCVISDCVVDANPTTGISTQTNGIVQNCQATGSAVGIAVLANSIISGCYLTGNSQGISASTGCIISGCEITTNTATGIITNSLCAVKDCLIANNAAKGIDTVTAGGSGAGTMIQGCTFVNNTGVAIDLSGSCLVRDCTIQPGGAADGIVMGTVNSSWIVNNHIRNAAVGHAGINCNGNNNRIDGNTFTTNLGTALLMGASSNSNVITRNAFLNNTTNYTNGGGGQKDAQLVTFGSGQVSTDPWLNIR